MQFTSSLNIPSVGNLTETQLRQIFLIVLTAISTSDLRLQSSPAMQNDLYNLSVKQYDTDQITEHDNRAERTEPNFRLEVALGRLHAFYSKAPKY